MSSSRLLTTLELDLISDSEEILSQAYSDLSRAGFTINVNYCLNSEIEKISNRRGIFILISEDLDVVDQSIEDLLNIGIETDQIIVGTVLNSFSHKLVSKALKLKSFSFDIEKSSLGPTIVFHGMIDTINSFGIEQLQLVLDRELRFARESGVMNILVSSVQDTSIEKITNRAILSNSLLNSISAKITFRSNSIRLAVFLEILKLSDPNQIVVNSRHLWPLRDEIRFATSMGDSLLKFDPIPDKAPLGLLVCLAAEMLLNREKTLVNTKDLFLQRLQFQHFSVKALLAGALRDFEESKGVWVDASA